MVKCTYCGSETPAFKGVHVLQNDGVVAFYCSSKCRVNALKLKRDKRRLKWTAAYREEKEKLAVREKQMKEKSEAAKKQHAHEAHAHAHTTHKEHAKHPEKKK